MLYVLYFKIHIKQSSDFAHGNKPNAYQTSEKKVPDPSHVMVIRIHKPNFLPVESGIRHIFACGIVESAIPRIPLKESGIQSPPT